jgi:hypothetical protein
MDKEKYIKRYQKLIDIAYNELQFKDDDNFIYSSFGRENLKHFRFEVVDFRHVVGDLLDDIIYVNYYCDEPDIIHDSGVYLYMLELHIQKMLGKQYTLEINN